MKQLSAIRLFALSSAIRLPRVRNKVSFSQSFTDRKPPYDYCYVCNGRQSQNFNRLVQEISPRLYRLFCLGNITIGTSAEKMTIKTIYKMTAKRDFSFDILEKCQKKLCVLRAGGFALSNLGEPREVLLKMAQLGLKNRYFPLAV